MTLIDELLKYAKSELKPPVLSPAPVYTKILLDDIAHNAQALARQQHNTLYLDVSPQLPELVLLDDKRLRQVLLNLIVNACKFTRRGTVRISVEAHQEQDSWRIRFAVADTGIGITDEQKDTIFEAFEQANPQSGGNGLGLLIAQNIVHAMGGKLTLQSETSQGSTFSFQILVPGLSEQLIHWTPPQDLPRLMDEDEPSALVQQQQSLLPLAAQPAGGNVPMPSHALLELALLARDGHVTDIERWLEDMRAHHPQHQSTLDEIKAALYALDLAKIERLALATAF